jgi:transmembrane sensor
MNREHDHSEEGETRRLVAYLSGELDAAATETLRDAYGTSADGTLLLDATVRALRTASPHVGSLYAGSPHAGSPHAGSPHAGSPHAGSPHAGSPHAGSPHAGSPSPRETEQRLTATRAMLGLSRNQQEHIPVTRLAWRRQPTTHSLHSGGRWFRGIAGGVAIIVVGLFGWRTAQQRDESLLQYATEPGQQKVVTLTDGSRIRLAPRTNIRVTSGASGAQTVELRGEAYFDVTVRGQRPFIVRTGRTTTRVLGTSFDVQSYPGDVSDRVTVASGRVQVHARAGSSASVIVTPGMVGFATDSTVVVTKGNLPHSAEWMSGRVVFREVRASDVLAALTRWYGIEFRFADSALASQHITVGLSTQSMQAALQSLKATLNLDLTVAGNVVTLRTRKGDRPPAGPFQQPRDHQKARPPLHTEVGR